ncbi:hypothetical protein MNV49_001753 [Pseudohyphozyma bogoriensis]|nr:hypothetical protein MNV49_001753 [Pseudohyphozyma bogoriensis]
MSESANGVSRVLSGATTSSLFDQFSLKGKVALVAGGAGALGLESAVALVEAGAVVYVLDIAAPENLKDDFKACQAFATKIGSVLHYVQGDITNTASVQKICQAIAAKEGKFDLCVLANGWLHADTPILDLTEEVWEKTQKINATGTFILAQAAAREMKKCGNGGSIVIYASIAGIRTQRSSPNTPHSWGAYAASKATTHQLTRQLAIELAKDRIRVNSISPGQFWTAMTNAMLDTNPALYNHWSQNNNPMGRLGRTDEVRGAVVYFCSSLSSYVTGTDMIIDGGMVLW